MSFSKLFQLLTVARHAPLSMGFPKQEYGSGLPFPSPGHLHDPGIELRFPVSPVSPALAAGFFTTEPSGKPHLKEEVGDFVSTRLMLESHFVFVKLVW